MAKQPRRFCSKLLRAARNSILKNMLKLTPEAIWQLNDKELLALLESGALKPKTNAIRFYAPSFTYYKTKHFCSSTTEFPTISVTGNACSLNCKHCGGKVLQTMHPALTPTELHTWGAKLKREGAKGVLVSGGCLPDGSVPLDEFVPVLERFKRELGLTVFVHTAIVSEKKAFALKAAGVDAALIDVIGSEETVAKVFNLKVSVQDYVDSLAALEQAKLKVVPHVIVGLNGSKLDGELSALKMIAQTEPAALVIIAFMPIRGTLMARTSPPRPIDIAKVAAAARIMFPQTPLVLGCMRPKGKSRGETDVLAIEAGVDGVAFPSNEAIEYAKNAGLEAAFSSYCCAQLYLDSIGRRF
jgi:lipoyl synthase